MNNGGSPLTNARRRSTNPNDLVFQMDWKLTLAFAGWLWAIVQFTFSFGETRRKNDAELLEKTLSYFERGVLSRSIGISLVEGVWYKSKKNLDVILPVLISQATFLLTESDDTVQEKRNLIRLFHLIHKCLPYANDLFNEAAEISESILSGARSEKGVKLGEATLRVWYSKYNNGNSIGFDEVVNA